MIVGCRVLLRGQRLDFSVGQTITPGFFHSCELFNQGYPAITRPRFLHLTPTSLFLPVVIHQATVRHRSKSTLGETWGGHKLSPKANNGKEFAGWGRVET